VLIIDDAHVLGTDGLAAQLIAAIVRHAPEPLHVVLASRGTLPLPTGRLLVEGLATEIAGPELSFNAEEAAELLGDVTAPDTATAVDALLNQTGGWAVAIAFAARVAGHGSNGDHGVRRRDRQLFAYFAEEVLAAETTETRAALGVAATLPWLTADLAAHLELGEAGARLTDTERTSIMMTPVADVPEAVAVTPLVRQLLGADLGAPLDASVATAAAAWYESCGALSAALNCLIRGVGSDAVSTFLRTNGQAMVTAGQGGDVLDALDAISPSTEIDVELAVLRAESLQAVGRADEAVERFAATVPPRGPIPTAVAWRLGALHYLRGDTDAASAVLERGSLGIGRAADDAGCLAWTAAIEWSRGERDAAVSRAQRALDLASREGDDKALATAYTVLTMLARVDGDHIAHHRYYARALEHAERAKDLLQLVRIRCNNGSHLAEDGEYDKALAELDVATRLADLGGYGMFRGLCLTNRAEALIATGRLDEAVADLDAARVIFRQVAPSMDAYPLVQLGEIYMARGDRALAVAAFEHAVAIATAAVEVQALVPALTGLALARLDDDPAAALDAATRAVAHEATVHHAKALNALGWVRWATGDLDGAVELAERAGRLARERGEHVALALALELAAACDEDDEARRRGLLADARALWAQVGSPLGVARLDVALAEMTPGTDGVALAASAADTLDRLGAKREAVRARAIAASAYDDTATGVMVSVLGGFAVLEDGLPVPTSSWQSKVARDLFKMLAINRGRPIHREVLIERLWPGEFGEKASNRLSVALSAVRNATDPGRTHPADHVVIADRDSVSLNVANVAVDVDQFLAEGTRGHTLLRQGSRAQGLALLRVAETRYSGDVLEEQPYADWALPLREEALAMYLSVGGVLAEADAASGDHESAARRYLRMIERDPYSENAYLGAVASLRAAGHHGSAQRLYATYVAKMADMGIEPATFPAA
jgi:DNA-binding SARP family transcriptional activator/tetratricopeptide (TPR) repeat protein